MSKYNISNYPRVDGSMAYFINEEVAVHEIHGIKLHEVKEIFRGTKEECEAKLKELRKAEREVK